MWFSQIDLASKKMCIMEKVSKIARSKYLKTLQKVRKLSKNDEKNIVSIR